MKKETAIKVIYYSTRPGPSEAGLRQIIETSFPQRNIEALHSLASLRKRLEKPLQEPLIVVLLTTDRSELAEVVKLREALLDRRIILVLPDDSPETASLGHKLRPRFITWQNGDYSDVAVVLAKMIRNFTGPDQEGRFSEE